MTKRLQCEEKGCGFQGEHSEMYGHWFRVHSQKGIVLKAQDVAKQMAKIAVEERR